MHRIHATTTFIGCITLGFASTALGGSGIPTIFESSAAQKADRSEAFVRNVAHGLLHENATDFRFRYFADLFLATDEHTPPGGLATNVTAAVFGQADVTPAGPIFGSGAFLGEPVRNGAANGALLGGGFGNGLVGSASAVNATLPGGTVGFSGGGGGGGGTTIVGDVTPAIGAGHPNPNVSPGTAAGNGNANGNLISFTDQPPHGKGHDGACCCCCCCVDLGFKNPSDSPGSGFHGPGGGGLGGSGNGDGTAAIPLPAPLWIGMIGLAAVGWMRRRRFVP